MGMVCWMMALRHLRSTWILCSFLFTIWYQHYCGECGKTNKIHKCPELFIHHYSLVAFRFLTACGLRTSGFLLRKRGDRHRGEKGIRNTRLSYTLNGLLKSECWGQPVLILHLCSFWMICKNALRFQLVFKVSNVSDSRSPWMRRYRVALPPGNINPISGPVPSFITHENTLSTSYF